MRSKMIKANILPAILILPILLVGCSSSKEEQLAINEQNAINEEASNNKIDNIFEGVWVSKDEVSGVNVYLKIRGDMFAYQTNKECYLTYEGIERVERDEVNGKITLYLVTHDEQEFETCIDVIDSETIRVYSVGNKEGTVYTRVTDKEAAREDLSEVWYEYFHVDDYSIEEFLEI